MRQLLIYIYLLLFSIQSPAQVFEDQYFRGEVKKGLDKVYNLEFEAGEQIFSRLKDKYEDHPGPYFLLALNRWWQSYISTTPAYHEYILKQLNTSLELNEAFEKRENHALEYTFFQYMGYAFKTRLHILQREWVKAANNGRKALKYLEQGFDFRTKAPEFYFSSGIYHYYAAVYPEDHSYVRPFMVFFPDGDEKLGLEELHKASDAQNFTQIEALFYLSDIYLEEKKSFEEALKLKARLSKKYPRNTWFAADYARSLIFSNQYSKASSILLKIEGNFEAQSGFDQNQVTSVKSRYTSLLMMRVYHYLGLCKMRQQLDYETASDYFEKSMKMAELAKVEADPHLPANMYHLGLCQEKLDFLAEAIIAYETALDLEENKDIREKVRARLKRLK
ncbi:MAG: tetratricopeptide repeat protein [Bacteroidia bacterium]|nr:tetratricopeptide repeat protein [Bacteroidia bacterium]